MPRRSCCRFWLPVLSCLPESLADAQHGRIRFRAILLAHPVLATRTYSSSERCEMPAEFGRWQTVCDAFARWRGAGVFTALMDAMIAEAARRGQTVQPSHAG
jgi:transposase